MVFVKNSSKLSSTKSINITIAIIVGAGSGSLLNPLYLIMKQMNKNATKLLNSFEKSYYCLNCHWAPLHGNKLTIITDQRLNKLFDESIIVSPTWTKDWLSSQLKSPTRAYCINGCHSYYAIDLEKRDIYYLGFANNSRLVTEIKKLLQ